MGALISIIIPVYNIAPYIEQCVTSVIHQSFHNFEILLVDDGSTDYSPQICDKLAVQDSRIRVIHQENKGLSGARNTGIQQAAGDYILYLDGDDWLDQHALEKLCTAINLQADLILFGFYYAYPDFLLLHKGYKHPDTVSFLERDIAMRMLLENDELKNFAWSCLIKRELALEVPFLEGKFFEDCYWKHLIIHHAKKIAYIPAPLYYYRQRESGISGTLSSKHIDLLEGSKSRIPFIHTYYPDLHSVAIKQHWELCYSFYKVTNILPLSERILFQNFFDEANKLAKKESQLSMPLRFLFWNHIPALLPLWELSLKILGKFSKSSFDRICSRNSPIG
jgi:glycosyltransferase involved in cell wall biosynthesis